MKRLRWILWQILMIPDNCFFLLVAALLLVFSLILPVIRLLRFAVRHKRGERPPQWRELLGIPKEGVRAFVLFAQLGWAAHRVRVGEV